MPAPPEHPAPPTSPEPARATGHAFPPEVGAGIVEHMNEDHADAVLALCRAYGRTAVSGDGPTSAAPCDATEARLVDITPDALHVEFAVAGAPGLAAIAFEPPIRSLDTVRARLVAMTRSAREMRSGA